MSPFPPPPGFCGFAKMKNPGQAIRQNPRVLAISLAYKTSRHIGTTSKNNPLGECYPYGCPQESSVRVSLKSPEEVSPKSAIPQVFGFSGFQVAAR